VYARIPGSFLHSFEQRIRIGGQPTIDHERAVFAAHGDHIAAGALEQEETAPQIRSCDFWRTLTCESGDGPGGSGRAGSLQKAPARQGILSYRWTPWPRA
jgi:hypothetical protein